MASSRYLITSTTLSSSAASVTFSSIPATYTDLVLKVSARDTNATADNGQFRLRFNGDTATNYSLTYLYGSGAAAGSGRYSNQTNAGLAFGSGDTAGNTSNTFTNMEIYIPNYTSTANKPFSSFSAPEQNGTNAYMALDAALYRGTSDISSIAISATTNYASGSTFTLYGLKNS